MHFKAHSVPLCQKSNSQIPLTYAPAARPSVHVWRAVCVSATRFTDMARLSTLAPRLAPADLRSVRPPEKIAAPFYSTPEWRALMAQLIAGRGRRCQKCGRTGCRIFGDHIKEIQDGGALLDPENIILLCGSDHTIKTNEQRAKRHAVGYEIHGN